MLAGAAREVDVVSEKDDLDYPGEREYVERLARAWGARLEVLTPPISPRDWIAAKAPEMLACDDVHSRRAGLSKAVFYGLMEESDRGRGLTMLGLRAEESGIRQMVVRRSAGRARERTETGSVGPSSDLTYWHTGARQWRCLPVGKFRGVDVYAYAITHGIDLLPVYRCVAFMHREEPDRIRKSWWLPGSHGAEGQIAWLARYYPSLYRQLRAWMPDAAQLR
jgi:3'-phosphoadenosine 5'-phosphosulfate sulfotransferase (PAPS reductase)/FAD synthetase